MKPSGSQEQLRKIVLQYVRQHLPEKDQWTVPEADVQLSYDDAIVLANIVHDTTQFKSRIASLLENAVSKSLRLQDEKTSSELHPLAVERHVRNSILIRVIQEWLTSLEAPLESESLQLSIHLSMETVWISIHYKGDPVESFLTLIDPEDHLKFSFKDFFDESSKKVFLIRLVNYLHAGNFLIDHTALDEDEEADVARSRIVEQRLADLRHFGFALIRASHM